MAYIVRNNCDGTLLIEGTCPVSGKAWELHDVNEYSFERWQAGALIQDAFPTMSADDRELLITGITPDAWESLFPEED